MASTPKLRDVAALAGVHPGTASRALNPATRLMVNADTARRVLEAARELGYQPSPVTKGLKSTRTLSVGMIIPDLTNPIYPPIVRGVEDVLRDAGYTALLANTDNDPEQAAAQFAALRSRQVDGFLIATAHRDDQLIAEAARAGISLVLIHRRLDTSLGHNGDLPPVPSVVGDERSGIEEAVRHLVDLGHTRIAHLAGPGNTSTGYTRLRAFQDSLATHRLPADDDLVVECGGYTEAAGEEALRTLLDRGKPVTAVVCGNDMIAVGCYNVLEERGVSCPDQLSLVGFNDMPLVDKLRPPLTTVQVPDGKVGQEAARLLLERIADPSLPARTVQLPLRFIRRGSTAPPPAPYLARGARYAGMHWRSARK